MTNERKRVLYFLILIGALVVSSCGGDGGGNGGNGTTPGTAGLSEEEAIADTREMCSDSPKFLAKVWSAKSEQPEDIAAQVADLFSSDYRFGVDYDLLYEACLEGMEQDSQPPPQGPSQPACEETERVNPDMTSGQIRRTLEVAYGKAATATPAVQDSIGSALDVFSGLGGNPTKALIDVIEACTDAQIAEDW